MKLTCDLQFDADRRCRGTPELSHTTGGLYREDSYLQEQFTPQVLRIGLYILWQYQKLYSSRFGINFIPWCIDIIYQTYLLERVQTTSMENDSAYYLE